MALVRIVVTDYDGTIEETISLSEDEIRAEVELAKPRSRDPYLQVALGVAGDMAPAIKRIWMRSRPDASDTFIH